MKTILFLLALGLLTVGCTTTDADDDPDSVVTEEPTDEPSEEPIVDVDPDEPDEPDEPDLPDTTLVDEIPPQQDPIPDPVVAPKAYNWEPNNSGEPPAPVSQASLRLTCEQVGPGVNAGYVRFGCKAYKTDGSRYGVVKGWWKVVRSDGVRSKAKDLNFRERGYDMAFDVPGPDAAYGISVRPGAGEARPVCPGCR